jgi:hypothetical protein
VLFTHGGVPRGPEVKVAKDMHFRSIPPSFEPVKSLDAWLERVDEWVEGQKEDWRLGRGGGGIWATRGGYRDEPDRGGSLMQYGMGYIRDTATQAILKNPTVVYASWLKDGMPFLPDGTADIFDEAGLQLIVCGHQVSAPRHPAATDPA